MGIIIAGFGEVEADGGVAFFARVFVRHIGAAGVGVDVAVGKVGVLFFGMATRIREHPGRAQVGGMEVAGRATGHLHHGHALVSGKDELHTVRAFAGIEFANVARRGRVALRIRV